MNELEVRINRLQTCLEALSNLVTSMSISPVIQNKFIVLIEEAKGELSKINIKDYIEIDAEKNDIKEIMDSAKKKLAKMVLDIVRNKEVSVEALKMQIDTEGIDEIIDKLKREGEIFEPRKGFIRKV